MQEKDLYLDFNVMAASSRQDNNRSSQRARFRTYSMNDVNSNNKSLVKIYKKSQFGIPESSSTLKSYEENVEVMFGRDSNLLKNSEDDREVDFI